MIGYAPQTGFGINTILGSSVNTLTMIEQSMLQFMVQVEQDPAVSPAETLVMQAQVNTWSTLVDMYSSITKSYTDTAKQVVNNMV